MSRAQIPAAGRYLRSGAGEPVPQNASLLFNALVRRLIPPTRGTQSRQQKLPLIPEPVMKEITVTEPAFVTRFSCSGSACRDHC